MSAKSTLALVTVVMLALAAALPTAGLARSLGGGCPGPCAFPKSVRSFAQGGGFGFKIGIGSATGGAGSGKAEVKAEVR
jgi:hypothetical protein